MRVGVWWAIPNPKIELLGDVYFRDHAYQIQTLISLIGTRRSPSHDTKNSPWKLWGVSAASCMALAWFCCKV